MCNTRHDAFAFAFSTKDTQRTHTAAHFKHTTAGLKRAASRHVRFIRVLNVHWHNQTKVKSLSRVIRTRDVDVDGLAARLLVGHSRCSV